MVALLNDRRSDPHNGSGQRITFDSQGPFGQLFEQKKQQPRPGRDKSPGKQPRVATDSSASRSGPKKSAMKLVPKHSGSEMGTGNSALNHNDEASFENAHKTRGHQQRTEQSDSSRDKSSVSKKTSKSRMSAKSKRSRSPQSAADSRRLKKKSRDKAGRRKDSEHREPLVQVSTERGSRAHPSGLADPKKKTREALLSELIRFKKPVLPSKKKKPASSVSSEHHNKQTEPKKQKKKPTLEDASLQERRVDMLNKSGSAKSRVASGQRTAQQRPASSVRSRERDPVQLSNVSSLLPSKVASLASDGLQTRKRKSVAVPKTQNR